MKSFCSQYPSPCLLVLLLGCKGSDGAEDSAVAEAGLAPVRFHYGEPVTCEDPYDGIDRFREEGGERGLDAVLPDPLESFGYYVEGRGGMVVAQDLDADGDIDLVFGQVDDVPLIYQNDGTGHFTALDSDIFYPFSANAGTWAVGVIDLDGDLLPELVMVTGGWVASLRNLGETGFDVPETLFSENQETGQVYLTLNMGDLDADGDLDMVLPGTGPLEGDPDVDADYGGPDRVFMQQEEGVFEHTLDLVVEGDGSRTMVAMITDRDGDLDHDIFIPADRGPPSAFWRNDGNAAGVPILGNDADEVWANLDMAAMGIDTADLNGDGMLDYCMSDVGPPLCLLSDGQGAYYEGAAAMGVVPKALVRHYDTVGWSVDLSDMDNDGYLDLLQSSGPDVGATNDNLMEIMDLFWQGQPDGSFEDVTRETGFGDVGVNFGLATADFDGDGWLDIAVAGPGKTPLLYMNRCGSESWLEVDLVGTERNSEGFGARIEATVGDTVYVRELTNLRSQAQTPSRFHLGLGDASLVDRLWVRWPDGALSRAEDVPVNRLVTIRHPEGVEWTPSSEGDGWEAIQVPGVDDELTNIVGYTFYAITNEALEGVLVSTLQLPGTVAETNGSGAYQLEVATGAEVDVIAYHDDYVPILAPIDTTWQRTASDGLNHPMMDAGSLVPFFESLGMEFDETSGVLWVQVVDEYHASLAGAEVSIDVDYSGVYSWGGSSAEAGAVVQEDSQFIFFGNVTVGDVNISIATPNEETCKGRTTVPVQSGTVTFVLADCRQDG